MRMHVMLVAVISLAAVGAVIGQTPPPPMAQRPGTSAQASAITIHQEIDFTASPARLYEALLDTRQFTEFTASAGAGPAQIDRAVGGAFSLFGGHIVGRNLELVPNRRIVQAWRVVDWPEGTYSIVRFELHAQETGTHLVFDHTGFPEGLHDHLAEGWEGHYWSLLRTYLH
jgi:activator of HSP90 ATPase